MKSSAVLTAVWLAVVSMATSASAQTLGDIARKEAERRKTVKTTGKVYTNDTLRRETPPAQPAAAPPQGAQPAGSPPASAPAAAGTQAGAAPGTAPSTPPAAGTPKDEAGWKQRITDAREALRRSELFADALQTRINALSTDFVNRDDPAQRNVIAADRQKALAELARVKEEIAQHQKSIAAIQEEARRAGVPAGWVR